MSVTGEAWVAMVDRDIHPEAAELLRSAGFRMGKWDGTPAGARLADVLIARLSRVSAEVLEDGIRGRLKLVGRHGVGLDTVDVATASALGILVTYAPDSNTISVAEHAIGLALALAKNLTRWHEALARKGDFSSRFSLMARELDGKTLGVIGLGRIGRLVATKCALGFNMHVIGYDPWLPEEPKSELGALGVELVDDMENLLARSDFVSVHVPLLPSTRGLIGYEQLRLMKPSAVLINCSRGAVVDEKGLYSALTEGLIAGAGVDVFEEEPPPKEHPIFSLENVVVTPHAAALTEEAFRRMSLAVARDVARAFAGELPVNAANPEVWPQFLKRRTEDGK